MVLSCFFNPTDENINNANIWLTEKINLCLHVLYFNKLSSGVG